jgi:hypothetical protein
MHFVSPISSPLPLVLTSWHGEEGERGEGAGEEDCGEDCGEVRGDLGEEDCNASRMVAELSSSGGFLVSPPPFTFTSTSGCVLLLLSVVFVFLLRLTILGSIRKDVREGMKPNNNLQMTVLLRYCGGEREVREEIYHQCVKLSTPVKRKWIRVVEL